MHCVVVVTMAKITDQIGSAPELESVSEADTDGT